MASTLAISGLRLAPANVCQFEWAPAVVHTKKVFDSFIYNGEEDMLVVRLKTLQFLVDYFVVVESRQSHQGKAKDVFFERAVPLLGKELQHKVIHIVLNDLEGEGPWDRENYHRRSLFTKGLTHPGREARDGDIVIMSDLDEIPKPDTLAALKGSDGYPKLVALECPVCYYSFANEGPSWSAPKIVTWETGLDAQSLRWASPDCFIPRSCWHCSYCFSSIKAVQDKLASFAHKEYSGLPYTDPMHIVNHTRLALDLFDRDEIFVKNVSPDAPAFVKASASLQYMMQRNDIGAGYHDA
ncbi:hypothetical protein MMC29_003504 [Sticta canariensis]|nr:hypothetical protein [Sticta canariensis]